jgi:transposase
MESTGVYWKPVYEVLEDRFDLIVGNAHRIKTVPGRKTDVKDSEWICDLARHGLIAHSFVPPRAIRELRDLTRYRRKLVDAAAAERNRLIKLLESAGIKLAGVVSDVFGVSGQAMIRALIEADRSPAEMAQLARGRMRSKLPRDDIQMPYRYIISSPCSLCPLCVLRVHFLPAPTPDTAASPRRNGGLTSDAEV